MSDTINTNEVTEEVVETPVEETVEATEEVKEEVTAEEVPVEETADDTEAPVEEVSTEEVVEGDSIDVEATEKVDDETPVESEAAETVEETVAKEVADSEEAPSDEAPVEDAEKATEEVKEEVKLPDEYTTKFSLSYSQYLAGQGKEEITEEDARALLDSVVEYYENDASEKEVRQFFEIPVEQKDLVEFRCYNISSEIVSNQKDYSILLTTLTVKFGERIVKDVVEQPVYGVVTEEAADDEPEAVEPEVDYGTPMNEVLPEDPVEVVEHQGPITNYVPENLDEEPVRDADASEVAEDAPAEEATEEKAE